MPLVVRRFHGQSALVSVMNTNCDRAVVVRAAFRRLDDRAITLQMKWTIPPGGAIDLDLESSQFGALGDGFIGSALLDASEPVAAVALVHISPDETGLYAYEGLPADAASTELAMPLFRARQIVPRQGRAPGRIDTGVAVANPGPQAATVHLEYTGTDSPAASAGCADNVTSAPRS